MESKTEIQWGLIGPGRIARRFAECLDAVPGTHLHAVASRDIEKAGDFADDFLVPEYYGGYQDMLVRSDIDAVYIATPHNFHFEQAKMCLEAGKAVLCEKPLTVNAEQAAELFSLAQAKGLFIMEALWSRYLPAWREAKALVKSGFIGDVVLADSRFGFRFPRILDDRVLNPDLAGGALLDIGIYPLALTQWMLDADPEDVKVHGILGETGVDELLSVSMRYGNGIVSQFSSTTLARTENDFNIYGTEGYLKVHANFWDGRDITLVRDGEEKTLHFPYRLNGFEYEAEEVVRCLNLGLKESPDMTHAHTLANLKVMDRIRADIGLKYPFE